MCPALYAYYTALSLIFTIIFTDETKSEDQRGSLAQWPSWQVAEKRFKPRTWILKPKLFLLSHTAQHAASLVAHTQWFSPLKAFESIADAVGAPAHLQTVPRHSHGSVVSWPEALSGLQTEGITGQGEVRENECRRESLNH